MIDYLKQINIKPEEINELKEILNKETLTNLEVMRHNVLEILNYLKDFGVNNIYNVLKYRPDICFKEKMDLERDLTVLDKKLLIFIFDNNIDDLINFRI